MIDPQLVRLLHNMTEWTPDKVESTAYSTNTKIEGVALSYRYTKSEVTISNSKLGTYVVFPRAGVLASINRTDYWSPSGEYWMDGQYYSEYEWGNRYFSIETSKMGTDYDSEIDDYTKWYYAWAFAYSSYDEYVWHAHPIRAVAELPL